MRGVRERGNGQLATLGLAVPGETKAGISLYASQIVAENSDACATVEERPFQGREKGMPQENRGLQPPWNYQPLVAVK